ncbi:unnamed protein product, partial [Pylaiella littoralis]
MRSKMESSAHYCTVLNSSTEQWYRSSQPAVCGGVQGRRSLTVMSRFTSE